MPQDERYRMTQLNALSLAGNLSERMVNFALDDNFVNDPELTEICHSIWSGAPGEGGLVSDMWVEGAFPSKTSKYSLDDLVDDGWFDASLRDVLDKPSAMPRDRKLYTHQYESIVRAQKSTEGELPSIVVTAGTGAGKTESFLLPILNDLYRNQSKPTEGVKCIILYPMNALVNDQVDRLYEWMRDQHRVTLVHFTSETPEDSRWANRDNVPTWDACRMRTRQQARGLEDGNGGELSEDRRGPTPDIMITNYSMLEYMLCRPQDAVFFGPALRHIVLDEAHLYTGTLAAEITLLLRRLMMRCGVKPENVQQFATSATLGTGDSEELLNFASQVFSKPKRLIHVLKGELVRPDLDKPDPLSASPAALDISEVGQLTRPTIVENLNGGQELAQWNDEQIQGLKHGLAALVSAGKLDNIEDGELRPAVVLHQALKAAPLLHHLQNILWDRTHVPLGQLASELFGDGSEQSVSATVALLHLAASARSDVKSYPLVPHRIHLLTRPTDGLSVCLNSKCDAPSVRGLSNLGGVMSGYHDVCQNCQSVAMSLFRCGNCGQWMLAGREDSDGVIKPETGTRRVPAAGNDKGTQLMLVGLNTSHPDTNVRIAYADGRVRGAGDSNDSQIELHAIEECPQCGGDLDADGVSSFGSGTSLAISLVAETILAEMPEFPSKGEGGNTWLPANGRRLLAFSDSRREAARLGVQLTSQHETQLVRSTIAKMMQSEPLNTEARLRLILRDIGRYEEDLRDPDLDRDDRNYFEQVLAGLRRQREEITAGGSIEDWSRRLGERAEMNQLLHRETSSEHESSQQSPWKQLKWEDNGKSIRAAANTYIAKEFGTSAVPGSAALEAMGLAEVTYPGIDSIDPHDGFIGTLPSESMRQSLSENWNGILAALCDTLRQGRVISLGQDMDDAYDFNGIPIAQWAAKSTDDGYGLARFVGATSRQRRMRFAMNVLERAGFSGRDDKVLEQMASDLLEACFDKLESAAKDSQVPWLESDRRQTNAGGTVSAIRLLFKDLGLRRPPTLYRCRNTGLVWARSVMGCAPADGVVGTLESVTHEELDRDARMGRRRREYQSSAIFEIGLWSEEHSAQLDPKENRRLQDLFKSGVRNILSATTTLELGIDIGGLNGVLMGNVPPGKANYLQRAGRAGRRADGSSVVVGFARPRPFDREVFSRIGDYLGSSLRKPMVFLDRERVVRRHLHALLLNEFFSPATSGGATGAMDAFGRMGDFCGVQRILRPSDGRLHELTATKQSAKSDGFVASLEVMRGNGNDLMQQRSERLLKDTGLEGATLNWDDLVKTTIEQFESAIGRWRADYDPLIEAYTELLNEKQHTAEVRSQAWALYYQARKLRDVTVIEALGDRQFMPRYGFPIGVQKLNVLSYDDRRDRVIYEDQYRLERPSLLALREYIPGSQLLVGGKLITSRGLMKHWTGALVDDSVGFRGLYAECRNEHVYYWSGSNNKKELCSVCGEQPASSPREFIFPAHGFTTASWDPPKWSTNIEIVGEAETVAKTFVSAEEEGVKPRQDFGGVRGLTAYYKEDGELLVYNEGKKRMGFAICLQCGYADSEWKIGEGHVNLPRSPSFVRHKRLNSDRYRCWTRNAPGSALRNQTLAARETTDVLLADFSAHVWGTEAYKIVTTLGCALQLAGAKLLQLDIREIGFITTPAGDKGIGYGVMLYDDVPGGAGHVRELLDVGKEWLEEARRCLWVDEAHDLRCKTACLDCLLSFGTQSYASRGLLERQAALTKLSTMLDKDALSPGGSSSDGRSTSSIVESVLPASQRSKDERIRRAQRRMQK